MAVPANGFVELPSTALADEALTSPNCRIERICSTGQVRPPDYWYDQEWNEWVMLLRGGARLLLEEAIRRGVNLGRDHLVRVGGLQVIAGQSRPDL